jgi:acylpyruvate hydrolase
MKLANLRLIDGARTLAVCLADGSMHDVRKLVVEPAVTIRDALTRGENYLQELADAVRSSHGLARIDARWVAAILPVAEADAKIFCVGLNYRSHADELGHPIPKQPSIFSRYGTTCVGHEQPILLPKSSNAVDWEGELALIIGQSGKYVAGANALSMLGGVTCFNDVSMRDFQERLPRITLAKNFDGSGPIGPWLVTMDEVGDIDNLEIETRVNGRLMQKSSTREFIFSVPFLVELISQVCTLQPGDVIATGTPAGVAWKRTPPNYLQDGDIVEIEISGIGVLRNVARRES